MKKILGLLLMFLKTTSENNNFLLKNLIKKNFSSIMLRVIKEFFWSILFNNFSIRHKHNSVGNLTSKAPLVLGYVLINPPPHIKRNLDFAIFSHCRSNQDSLSAAPHLVRCSISNAYGCLCCY